jgi:uncharacterized delta-60 repeat protein
LGVGYLRLDLPTSSPRHYTLAISPDNQPVLLLRTDFPNPSTEIRRFLSSGAPDSSFGTQGIVSFPGEQLTLRSLAFYPDGRMVVVGHNENTQQGWLTRLMADGQVDPSFGDSGVVRLMVGDTSAELASVALQPNGQILTAGVARGSRSRPGLFRLQPQGQIDSTFGQNGLITFGVTTLTTGWRLRVQADGRILINANLRGAGGNFYNAGLQRFLPDGSPDSSFAQNGALLIVDTTLTYLADIGIQADGKLIIAGQLGYETPTYPWVRRFSSDGVPDLGYGVQGTQLFDACAGPGQVNGYVEQMIVHPSGHLYAVGSFGCMAAGQQTVKNVLSLTSDGQIDQSFGVQGVASLGVSDTILSYSPLAISQVAVDADNRLYVVATVRHPDTSSLYLFRLNGSALTTSVSPAPSPAAWQAFPNPFEDQVILTGDVDGLTPIEVIAYDLTGRTVAQHKWTPSDIGPQRLRWDLSSHPLPAGCYYLRLTSGTRQQTLTLIKR